MTEVTRLLAQIQQGDAHAAELDLADHARRWIENGVAVEDGQPFNAAEVDALHHLH